MIRLPLEIQRLEEGAYLATSSVLPGFLVQGDTVEEVLELAPGVARSLLEAMREKGVPWPWEQIPLPCLWSARNP